MPNTILITSSGSMATECVTTALNAAGHTLIGTDIYPPHWVGVEQYFHKVHTVPCAHDAHYIQSLLKLCQEYSVEYIFPLTDPEIDTLNAHRSLFEERGIQLCISQKSSITTARNKLNIAQLSLHSAVRPIPTATKSTIHTLHPNKKIIAKPIFGRSSQRQYLYPSIIDIPPTLDEGYIFQNFIDGDVYVVDYLRDDFGAHFTLTRKELLRTPHGAGLSVHVHENALLERAAAEIGEKFTIRGCINMEFIFDGSTYYLMDINPRFSAGIAFSHLSGVNFVENHLRCFQGKALNIPKAYKNNYHGVKRYMTFCTEMCDA